MHSMLHHLLHAFLFIKRHTCTGDGALEMVVVEEPQEVEVIDKPPEIAQGRPLCIPMLCKCTNELWLIKCIAMLLYD
jgi:hypothetical protein